MLSILLALVVTHHEIDARLDPERHAIVATDRVTFEAPVRSAEFELHAGLAPQAADGTIERIGVDGIAERWRLKLPSPATSVAIAYGGTIDHPIAEEGEDYARSFGETPGAISPKGVYLSGTSRWIPRFDASPFAFTLRATVPAGWEAVSQGRRTAHDETSVVWDSPERQTEAYLIAGPLVETSRTAGGRTYSAYLRTKDDALASKYLDATVRYVQMYEELLGPYPYPKFALVENFWETGYGMPSFTLLGPGVIRLPFIVSTSYPHEILHNWWGNGVYVDERGGNWSEGLTAYLADHLLAEQNGDASEYRQTTLQKYADYAASAKDFPLARFRARHSPATEAVGYGKALMLFHELRRSLGDEAFVVGLRKFYETNRFREASFDDLRRALEAASGKDLEARFEQAVKRTGAPAIALSGVAARPDGDGFLVTGTVEQKQDGEPYSLTLPLAITMEGEPAAFETSVPVAKRIVPFSIRVPRRPLRLDADPSFDVFRKLDPRETPPALTRAFGASRSLAIVPSAAPASLGDAYRALVEGWSSSEPGKMEIVSDADLREPPSDRVLWIFGKENRFWSRVGYAPEGSDLAFAAAVAHPVSPELVQVGIAAARPEQVPGLGRKLPHYHKYSYVVFTGDEPTNTDKGRWPVADSPMTVFLGEKVERGALAKRSPLATPPPAFSTERIGAVVTALAAMDGRKPGTEGHRRARELVAAAFREAGLSPEISPGPENVVARIAGTNPELKGAVVVGAHYDHLGPGFPGADDDASGIAAMLELARAFASGPAPARTIVFAAFDGEETGRLGSKALAASLPEVFAMVNLDTVGRLGDRKLLVLGTGTAKEWVHIFRGAGFVTGVPVESVAADPGGSDQVSFQERGVPAVQLFSGPHLDYHAAGDVAEKVDLDGIAKAAAVAREAIEYLAGRAAPLTHPLGAAPVTLVEGERKVSLGTVPDFAFPGPGVRVQGVVPGSPAERAGLAGGDVILSVGGRATLDLRALSAVLKSLSPGQKVVVRYVRDGKTLETEAEVAAR